MKDNLLVFFSHINVSLAIPSFLSEINTYPRVRIKKEKEKYGVKGGDHISAVVLSTRSAPGPAHSLS